MPIQVIMPQLGESVIEGTITRWLKAPGDSVEEYEPLLEINTDKVDTEIPSPAAGVLLVSLVPEGVTVQAGTLLAWIGQPGDKVPVGDEAPVEVSDSEKEASVPAMMLEAHRSISAAPPLPGRDRNLGFISPVVARIASEHNIDLYQVRGSGQGGRITKKDVLAYMDAGQTAPVSSDLLAALTPAPLSQGQAILPGEVLKLTPVRKAIAEHMVHSKRTSPHVTTVMEVDLSKVVAHRLANKEIYAHDGVNLTFTPYFVAASVGALLVYPIANASWGEEGIYLHSQINIGVATSLGKEGLIVPVIKRADTYSLLGLARMINDLASRARDRKLQPDEVRGGTFTITNHGTSGSLFATPIINQPQCAILGVGAIQKRVVVMSDEDMGDTIAIRPMVYLSLTFDHRILDGAIADTFLGKVVELLRNWT